LNYGWGFNAAFAVTIWLMARLSAASIGKPVVLVIACFFWNLGVALGILGVLSGHGTSLDAIEMPAYVGPILFGSSVFIAMWGILNFRSRTSPHVYISQWYLLAALLWFPWMFSVAQIMLFVDPARGTVQSLVHAWYSHGLTVLWFTPIGIAAIYYLLPKLLLRPVANYYLCVYGFWPLAIFGGWTGTAAAGGRTGARLGGVGRDLPQAFFWLSRSLFGPSIFSQPWLRPRDPCVEIGFIGLFPWVLFAWSSARSSALIVIAPGCF
jgi:cbb3-type cytochrome oxidase subunit 1